jgi:ferredoxin-NADP reductase
MNSPSAQEPGLTVYSAAVLNRHWLSEKTFEIELTRPSSFAFKPGQRIRSISESIERDYSLISTSADPHLGLCVRQVEGGILSPALASAIAGTRFYFTGPHGHFTFRPSPRRAIFVATGTGIAPFVSMGRSGANGFLLLHGVPAASELYYETFFRSLAEAMCPVFRERHLNSRNHTAPFKVGSPVTWRGTSTPTFTTSTCVGERR